MAKNDLADRAQRDIEALVELLKPDDRKILLEMTKTELMRLYHGYGHSCAISSVRTNLLISSDSAPRRPHLIPAGSMQFSALAIRENSASTSVQFHQVERRFGRPQGETRGRGCWRNVDVPARRLRRFGLLGPRANYPCAKYRLGTFNRPTELAPAPAS
jgi:hypothetical protein